MASEAHLSVPHDVTAVGAHSCCFVLPSGQQCPAVQGLASPLTQKKLRRNTIGVESDCVLHSVLASLVTKDQIDKQSAVEMLPVPDIWYMLHQLCQIVLLVCGKQSGLKYLYPINHFIQYRCGAFKLWDGTSLSTQRGFRSKLIAASDRPLVARLDFMGSHDVNAKRHVSLRNLFPG